MLGWDVFPVSRIINNLNKEVYRIDAGSIHGVHENSLFKMYAKAAADSEANRPICTLRAARIYPLQTEATITKRHDKEIVSESGFARLKCGGKALKVHFTPALKAVLKKGIGYPDITLCVKEDERDVDFTVTIEGEKGVGYLDITLTVKEVEEDADFILDLVGDNSVAFVTNIKAVTDHGFTRLPEVVPAEPEPIIDVLRAASQWTQHLDHSNLTENIEIEFYSLEKTTDAGGVTVIQRKEEVPHIKKNTVSLTVLPNNDDMYGLVMRNKTKYDLHVSIVMFDIDNLAIRKHN